MQQYVEHITEHLWKENNRLFMMTESRLQYVWEKVEKELNNIEEAKLKETRKTRKLWKISWGPYLKYFKTRKLDNWIYST